MKAWEQDGKVTWRPAADGEAQEKAIDDLLSTWDTDFLGQLHARGAHADTTRAPRDSHVFSNLAPGSVSAAHRRVLRFAAAEYDRLGEQSASDPAASPLRDRLAEKA